jgi:hypothetical protein
MAQLLHPAEAFGEVNLNRHANGSIAVRATVLIEPDIEGARAGLALDASASMKKAYGANVALSPIFRAAAGVTNQVEPVARIMAEYLAKFSSSGQTNVIYWACGVDGSKVEPIGAFPPEASKELRIQGPRKEAWGRGTKLLPPMRYFVEECFADAPWAICVFVTDGMIEDLDAVKDYSRRYAKEIAAGKRKFVKMVLLGVGDEVNEAQMEELDDMFEDSPLRDPKNEPIDIWDHKLTSEMTALTQIFAEVVTEKMIVAASGRVLDHTGRVVHDYADGVPAILRFTLPRGATAFTLELANGAIITQDLTDGLDRI